jgi:hypothetical protein
MKVLYVDPILGVSGDMILAALIDLGVSMRYIKKQLRFIPDFNVKVSRVMRQGISARHIQFTTHRRIQEKHFIPLITKSTLSPEIKETATKIIKRIFAVEKKVHRSRHLHLHELADADTLFDIVGALVAIDYLRIDKIYTRPVKAGTGFIKTVEGNMPAFNVATAELLKNFPVEFLPIPAELTTPTGAAILSTIATPRDDFSLSTIRRVGMGAGTMDIEGYPNLLRIFYGEIKTELTDECLVLATNIDDMNPQDYDMLYERLYSAGALEVFITPVIMKHSRPGVLLTVLCQHNQRAITNILFNETTTLGVRMYTVKRIKVRRRPITIASRYGPIRAKIVEYNGTKRFSIEYQVLKKIALKYDLSIRRLRAELTKLIEKKTGAQPV